MNQEEDATIKWIHALHWTENCPYQGDVRMYADSISRSRAASEKLFARGQWDRFLSRQKDEIETRM
jgi:hypothetical protein